MNVIVNDKNGLQRYGKTHAKGSPVEINNRHELASLLAQGRVVLPSQKPDVSAQKPEVKDQKSETSAQKPQTKN